MKKAAKWQLVLGLVLAGSAGRVQGASAGTSEPSLTLTVRVLDYAKVAPKTLNEAEKVASGIFQKAGVRTQWADAPVGSENMHEASPDQPFSGLSHLQLTILPRAMADRLSPPASMAGLAPGAGPDRMLAYVFYNRVEDLFYFYRKTEPLTKGQILGQVIAHEIGHILLNLSVHTETGIMRGTWDQNNLRDIRFGVLLFTKQQDEVIRTEVARRSALSER